MKTNPLMKASMEAAVNLVQSYDAGLTENALCTRMERIANDLMIMVEDHRENNGDE